jgi:hypothetical protein
MGQLLQQYLAASLPALRAIVDEQPPQPSMPRGIRQPEGATTFPMGPEAGPMQGQPIGPGGQPTAPIGAMPPPGGGLNPAAAAPAPSFDTGQPQPAIPPVEPKVQPKGGTEFEKGPNSFSGMSEDADPKDINNAVNALEESGVNIDEAYSKVTGNPMEQSEDDPTGKKKNKDKKGKLTRQEKGLILMEFGLSLMAQSGTGQGTLGGDIGIAGTTALRGHMGRKEAQQKTLAEAEDKRLERELKKAQISKAQQKDTMIGVGPDGNQVLIDKQSGQMIPILMDGKPVPADQAAKLDFEIKQQAFINAFDSQIEDKSELKRRAAAFAAGVHGIAFPELARQDAALMMRKELEKKPKQKWPVGGGKEVKWEDLTPKQKSQITHEIVDGAYEAAATGVSSDSGADPTGILAGLSQEQRAGLK